MGDHKYKYNLELDEPDKINIIKGLFKIMEGKADYKTETDRVYFLNNMIMEIKHKFLDCNAVIILEKGKVIEVL